MKCCRPLPLANLDALDEALVDGVLVAIEPTRLRIRRLPLVCPLAFGTTGVALPRRSRLSSGRHDPGAYVAGTAGNTAVAAAGLRAWAAPSAARALRSECKRCLLLRPASRHFSRREPHPGRAAGSSACRALQPLRPVVDTAADAARASVRGAFALPSACDRASTGGGGAFRRFVRPLARACAAAVAPGVS